MGVKDVVYWIFDRTLYLSSDCSAAICCQSCLKWKEPQLKLYQIPPSAAEDIHTTIDCR